MGRRADYLIDTVDGFACWTHCVFGIGRLPHWLPAHPKKINAMWWVKESNVASIAWSWRHGILKSGLPAPTRHVLLTISCYMNDVGGGCYPSIKTISEDSGLSKRSVITHIANAVMAGWLIIEKHGFGDQRWKRNEYSASWPKGGERHAPRRQEGGERGAQGGEPHDAKVVQEVHTILPMNLPSILPGGETPPAMKGGALSPQAFFDARNSREFDGKPDQVVWEAISNRVNQNGSAR